ncbi:hypothetical protein WJX73_005595 [Symbiochloris irregularis]|uniref:Methyltransferase domain-containing protein n=1 Tax=Symbiochloris irregularis TaxID=706552 RepID=A0AAW1PZK6_9CHLO
MQLLHRSCLMGRTLALVASPRLVCCRPAALCRRGLALQLRAQAATLTAQPANSVLTTAPPDPTTRPPAKYLGTVMTDGPKPEMDDVTAGMMAGTIPKPGESDRSKFKLHWSVDFWRDFRIPQEMQSDDSSIGTKFQTLASNARKAGVWTSPQSVAYWTYHMGRSTLLALQGFAGLWAAERTAQALAAQTTSSKGRQDTVPRSGGWKTQGILKWGIGPLYEAMAMFWQDYKNITAGAYKLPWDMTTTGHRQWNPLHIFSTARAFISEAVSTLERRNKGLPEDVWLRSPLYPEYYMNTFHYQTDGWLSQQSAQVYELSTETLFVGRQDAMQRQTLIPLADHFRSRPAGAGAPKILEVACGTGRFATFLKDNHPTAQVTALDLSPYYLAEARKNLADWARLRGGSSRTTPPVDAFLQAPAEGIPMPDGHYDAVTCVYLFHELPPEVRRKVAKEMARVVKPGGMVVLTDSAQLGDRPQWDATMGGFSNFNEPYYRSFIATDLGALFEDAGLKADMKLMASSTKVLSFTKPLPASSGAQ